MSLSIRSRFILISVSITIIALLLFGSVLHDRAINYKHQQEKNSYRVLTAQLFKLVANIEDLSLIKKSLSEGMTSVIQPAQIFAILNEQGQIVFHYTKHDLKEGKFKDILADIKEKSAADEGYINKHKIHYYWSLNKLTGYTDNNYSLLIIYPLSSSVTSEFLEFFGLPFLSPVFFYAG